MAITGEDCAEDPTCKYYENDNDNESNGLPGKFTMFPETNAAVEFEDDDDEEEPDSLSRSQFRSVITQALALMVSTKQSTHLFATCSSMPRFSTQPKRTSRW
jgi:hypothetical protein